MAKTTKTTAKKATAASTNLPVEEARVKVLKSLKAGRKTRTELKAAAPYGNYTALMNALETEGLIKQEKLEEDSYTHYVLTAKGKAAASK